LDLLIDRKIRDVQRLVHVKMRNIDVHGLRDVTRVAAQFNLADYRLEESIVLAYAKRFANQMQGYGDLDLFSDYQAPKVGMDQATLNRIDLAGVKHHLAGADTIDIQSKDRIAA